MGSDLDRGGAQVNATAPAVQPGSQVALDGPLTAETESAAPGRFLALRLPQRRCSGG
jgi:hypothetical protein